MSNCNYRLLQDLYTDFDADFKAIAEKIDALEFSIDVDSLDIDLDNLESQLLISNQLHFLDAVGTDIMTEEEQAAAYASIKTRLFAPSVSGGTMEEEEGEW